jgi:hypothetical protein
MEEAKLILSATAIVIALASFLFAQRTAARAKKAEAIRNLLGEKETVAYAALRLLREGSPKDPDERQLVFDALAQACVFEGSDRARALLYRVIEQNRQAHSAEIAKAVAVIEDTFASMDAYAFKDDELDLGRGRRRLTGLKRVLKGARCSPDSC